MASSSSNVVGVHYRVGKKIGESASGVMFEGTSLLDHQQVAVMFESRKSDNPLLRDEYRACKKLVGCPGIPKTYYFGQQGLHNILIMDLLGPSLEYLFDHCSRRFSIKTVVMLAKQMISRVQTIHEKNLIYRDITPINFLIGRSGTEAANVIHVVNLRLTKQYRDPKTGKHIPYGEKKSLLGAARYMSINAHLGREQSRRDDLAALGYVFMYFLRGSLPWQGMKAATKIQKHEKIGKMKQTTAVADLCNGFPGELNKYLSYVSNLGFDDTPDYDYLRDLFTQALKTTGEAEDGEYDWITLNGSKGWEAMKQHPSQQKLGRTENNNMNTVTGIHPPESQQLPSVGKEANAVQFVPADGHQPHLTVPLLRSNSPPLRPNSPPLYAPPSPRFFHKSLDVSQSEIRILKMLYAPKYQNQPDFSDIVCSIEHVPLINPGVYVALSYCWGNSQEQRTILIDGLPFLVTASLHSALRHVRDFIVAGSPPPSPISVRLWVDALCINQEDTDEKGTQVRLMRQIYSRAREVVCYIRDETPGMSSWAVADAIKSNFISQAENCDADTEKWTALESFFSESYWSRVWVVQEIAVAIRVTVLYGGASISWDGVAATLTSWKENSQILPLHSRGFLNAIHLVKFRQRFMVARQPIRLLDAMHWSTKTQATDPRDKIFALLGLCYDSETYVPIPNYRQPLEEILHDMGRRMMLLNRSLDLICLKGINAARKPPTSPTWLPDWPNIWSGSLSLLESRILEKHNIYNLNPMFDSLDLSKLKVRGVLQGNVTGTTSVMSPHRREIAKKPPRLPWILLTASLQSQNICLQSGKPDEISTRDAISKALTMDLLPQSMSASAAEHCFSLLWMPEGRGAIHNLDLIDWIDTNAWFRVGKWTLREWSQFVPATPHPSSNTSSKSSYTTAHLELYLQTMERVLGSGLKLAVVNEGLVGSAHPDVEVGDSIYWIQGCDKPVAFRKERLPEGVDVYRVVGAVRIQYDVKSPIFRRYRDFTIGNHSEDHTLTLNEDVEELTLI